MKTDMNINQRDEQGRPHGPWEVYWSDGQLWRKGEYKHGRNYGLWEYYYENVQPWAKGELKNEKQIGLWYEEKYD